MRNLIIFLPVFGLVLLGCNSDRNSVEPDDSTLTVYVSFNFDLSHIADGTFFTKTEAGYPISISRLQFYLSDWLVERKDGSTINSDIVSLIDAQDEDSRRFSLDIEAGSDWETMHFLIGLPTYLNHTNALENTLENQNMAWPDPMGGGYHFLKLEGRFMDGEDEYGYAMHIGTDPYVIPVQMHLEDKAEVISQSGEITLEMSIKEWFANPHTYDFNQDGNYSMGDTSAMLMLAQNGQHVFTLKN